MRCFILWRAHFEERRGIRQITHGKASAMICAAKLERVIFLPATPNPNDHENNNPRFVRISFTDAHAWLRGGTAGTILAAAKAGTSTVTTAAATAAGGGGTSHAKAGPASARAVGAGDHFV
jgi:hypothetical protein